MKLSALVETPKAGKWNAVFAYEDERGRIIHDAPVIRIPCISYDHAKAVVGAFQYPPVEEA